jgi:hypothetical protein
MKFSAKTPHHRKPPKRCTQSSMKVRIVKCDWFLGYEPNEGTVFFETESGKILEAYSYDSDFIPGEICEVDIFHLSDPNVGWEVIFKENPEKVNALVKANNDWDYYGYGRIVSINPIIIDFGSISLDAGNWSQDDQIIGEYIYWKIDRLDISKI